MSLSARSRRSWVLGLLVGVLVVSISVFGVYADEEQTPSEMVKIGYEHVGSVMSSVSGAEVDKSERVKEALGNLFYELADHLSEKGVPEQVVDRFETQADSVLTLYENGLINSQQLGMESSNIVKSAGRHDPDGKVSSSVLKRAGVDDEKIQELAEKGPDELDGAEMAQEMVSDRDRKVEQERVEEKEESGNMGQEKANNRGADEQEEKEDEEDKGPPENSNGNPGNSGKDKEEAKDESSGEENNDEKGEEKGEEKGNSEAGKPDETPGRDRGKDDADAEGQNDDQGEASSDQSQEDENLEEDDQEQEGPGNSGNNPGNSGKKGNDNEDEEEDEDDENPGKSKGKGRSGV